jgi:hypothetical protein
MPRWTSQPWQRDSTKFASGKLGAVQLEALPEFASGIENAEGPKYRRRRRSRRGLPSSETACGAHIKPDERSLPVTVLVPELDL